MKYSFCLIIISILLFFYPLYSQETEGSMEIDSLVPDLYDFHEIIYPIWHNAYPEKNVTMLKEMVGDVNLGAEKIYSAELPEILSDKAGEWEEGVRRFRLSVEKYNKAMEGNDETAMLITAKELHSNYEMLVRIIKPITKEFEDFHKVLYMITHHYWPDKNREDFGKAVDDMELRAEELNNCILPKWASDKSDIFLEKSKKLYESTKKLRTLKDAGADDSDIKKAIESVHDNYIALKMLFNE